jgi:hypothetical protein
MTYYDLLEVSPSASVEVVRAAYKSLMQRYHPDKNPGNTHAAERAARVAQAYDVIINPEKRTAYDLSLKARAIERARAAAGPGAVTSRRGVAPASRPRSAVPRAGAKASHWLPWGIIGIIVVSGVLILVLNKTKKPWSDREVPAVATVATVATDGLTAKDAPSRDAANPSGGPAAPAGKPDAAELVARTTALYSTTVTIALQGAQLAVGSSGYLSKTEYLLVIPRLVVKVGGVDFASAVRDIEGRRDAIGAQLGQRLAVFAYPPELRGPEGEAYLKRTIVDALATIMQTNRGDNPPPAPPDAPGRAGVVDVFLPEGFFVKESQVVR